MLAALLGATLLLGACGDGSVPTGDHTTEVTNPSPAPSNPAEPQENTNRTAAPNETPAPAETGTPTS